MFFSRVSLVVIFLSWQHRIDSTGKSTGNWELFSISCERVTVGVGSMGLSRRMGLWSSVHLGDDVNQSGSVNIFMLG